jgi:hypothetical protein
MMLKQLTTLASTDIWILTAQAQWQTIKHNGYASVIDWFIDWLVVRWWSSLWWIKSTLNCWQENVKSIPSILKVAYAHVRMLCIWRYTISLPSMKQSDNLNRCNVDGSDLCGKFSLWKFEFRLTATSWFQAQVVFNIRIARVQLNSRRASLSCGIKTR